MSQGPVYRGRNGLLMGISQYPSPPVPPDVTLSPSYRRNPSPVRAAFVPLAPAACGCYPGGLDGLPIRGGAEGTIAILLRTPRRLAFALGLALLPPTILAPTAEAQGRSAEERRTIESYRLTMPVLRKVLPALYAKGAALQHGNASMVAEGPLRDNALLLQQHDPEIKRLTGED